MPNLPLPEQKAIADPYFAHCKAHSDKITAKRKVRKDGIISGCSNPLTGVLTSPTCVCMWGCGQWHKRYGNNMSMFSLLFSIATRLPDLHD